MSIVARKGGGAGTIYWVVFTWKKKRVWERSGANRADAVALEKRRLREVAAGTYETKLTGHMRAGEYVQEWAQSRTNRNAHREANLLDLHVVNREGFADVPLQDLEPSHMLDLVAALKQAVSEETGKPLATKHVANIYGLVRKAMREARVRRLISSDPCEGLGGQFGFSKARSKVKTIYTREEIAALLSSNIDPDRRIWNALAFFTGMRCGEICGRRWRDFDRSPSPLASLLIDSQYDGRDLKTGRPRVAPVHPLLRYALEWWWSKGFEFVYARKPKADDFIVPRRVEQGAHPHTESSSYKAWIASCAQAGVTNRSVHSTRHTFITMCRRGGAQKDIVQRITHNPKGDIVDQYTHFDWEPLCSAVLALTGALINTEIELGTSAGGGSRRLAGSGHGPSLARISGNSAGGSSAVEFPVSEEGEPDRRFGQRSIDSVDALRQRDAEEEAWAAVSVSEAPPTSRRGGT